MTTHCTDIFYVPQRAIVFDDTLAIRHGGG